MKSQTLGLLLIGGCSFLFSGDRNHIYQRSGLIKTMPEFTDFEGSARFLFDMTKNPVTGKIPEGAYEMELVQAKSILETQRRSNLTQSYSYNFQGPIDLGGRCRTVVFDVRYNGTTNKTLMAGGVSAGVYKSVDDGSTWIRKGPTYGIYSLTSIAQDPRPGFQDTWYYSTGESYGGGERAAPIAGDGVYKSLDNGETWFRLGNSNTGFIGSFDRQEDCIWRIAVAPNGDVYIAAIDGIFRSTNGGENWSLVLMYPVAGLSSFNSTDIVITASGRLYAAFSGNNTLNWDGVWTSSSGDAGSWTRIAGEGPGGSPAGWNAENTYGRIVLALAPSNENILYAFIQTWVTGCYPGVVSELFKWDLISGAWVDLSNNLPGCSGLMDPLTTQTGYDMVLAIKPDDPNVIFIGGTNLYRSTDGFTSTSNITQIGGYNNFSLHPDMHWISFQPGNPNVMLVGNDGGIQLTTNDMASNVSWYPINTGFITYQYYYVTLDPATGSNKVLGGAQDNGTTRNRFGSGIYFEQVYGGDGGAVGLSKNSGGIFYEYLSIQDGEIYRKNASQSFITPIKPSLSPAFHLFISPLLLDPDNTEYLYYVYGNRLFRTNSASTVNSGSWTEMTGVSGLLTGTELISALATTRGNYDPTRSSLFFANQSGKVYRIDDPINSNPANSPVKIFDDASVGFISSISVNPRNDDTVLITTSSYGTISIWWTGNANSLNPSWTNIESNLSAASIRSSAIAITSLGIEYFVGTSVGLYKTTDPFFGYWEQEGPNEIGNAVVTSLALRPSDNRLLVGTYGYGMWVTTLVSDCEVDTWIGTTDNDWNNGLNWSCGIAPDKNTHVIIPASPPNVPYLNANTTIKSLTLEAGAALIIASGFHLTVTGPF